MIGLIFINASLWEASRGILRGIGANLFSSFTSSNVLYFCHLMLTGRATYIWDVFLSPLSSNNYLIETERADIHSSFIVTFNALEADLISAKACLVLKAIFFFPVSYLFPSCKMFLSIFLKLSFTISTGIKKGTLSRIIHFCQVDGSLTSTSFFGSKLSSVYKLKVTVEIPSAKEWWAFHIPIPLPPS